MDTLISFVYAISGFIIAGMYVPQAISAIRSRGEGVSVMAWSGWTFTSLSACLYAWFVVQDTLFFVMSCLNVIGCAVILGSRLTRR